MEQQGKGRVRIESQEIIREYDESKSKQGEAKEELKTKQMKNTGCNICPHSLVPKN